MSEIRRPMAAGRCFIIVGGIVWNWNLKFFCEAQVAPLAFAAVGRGGR